MSIFNFEGLDWDGIRWTCGDYEIRRTCSSWHIFKGEEHHGRFADFTKAAARASEMRMADLAAAAQADTDTDGAWGAPEQEAGEEQ